MDSIIIIAGLMTGERKVEKVNGTSQLRCTSYETDGEMYKVRDSNDIITDNIS